MTTIRKGGLPTSRIRRRLPLPGALRPRSPGTVNPMAFRLRLPRAAIRSIPRARSIGARLTAAEDIPAAAAFRCWSRAASTLPKMGAVGYLARSRQSTAIVSGHASRAATVTLRARFSFAVSLYEACDLLSARPAVCVDRLANREAMPRRCELNIPSIDHRYRRAWRPPTWIDQGGTSASEKAGERHKESNGFGIDSLSRRRFRSRSLPACPASKMLEGQLLALPKRWPSSSSLREFRHLSALNEPEEDLRRKGSRWICTAGKTTADLTGLGGKMVPNDQTAVEKSPRPRLLEC